MVQPKLELLSFPAHKPSTPCCCRPSLCALGSRTAAGAAQPRDARPCALACVPTTRRPTRPHGPSRCRPLVGPLSCERSCQERQAPVAACLEGSGALWPPTGSFARTVVCISDAVSPLQPPRTRPQARFQPRATACTCVFNQPLQVETSALHWTTNPRVRHRYRTRVQRTACDDQ